MNTTLSQLRQSLNKKGKGGDIVFVAANQDVLKGNIKLKAIPRKPFQAFKVLGLLKLDPTAEYAMEEEI